MPSKKKTPDTEPGRYVLTMQKTRFAAPENPATPDPVKPKVPTKAARKAATKAAPAPSGRPKGSATGPNPTPTSRRARRAAIVARRVAYREAMMAWAIGAKVSNGDALRAIGLAAAHKRPSELGSDVGGMDRALEAMEAAAGRELPAQGPVMAAMVKQYHAGIAVWQARKKRREEAAKADPDALADAAEDKAHGPTGNRMRRNLDAGRPVRIRRLHRALFDLADGLVRAAWRSPANRTASEHFHLSTVEAWDGGQITARALPRVDVPNSRARGSRVVVRIDPNVLPLWRAGLARHYGENTLIVGVCRDDPSKVHVAAQRGPFRFTMTRRSTPR